MRREPRREPDPAGGARPQGRGSDRPEYRPEYRREYRQDADRGLRHLDHVLAPLGESSAPLVHDLSRAVRGVADAAEELHESGAVKNFGRVAADAAALTDYTRAGHGTLGALLIDPTVYERLVTALGGAARSRLLRTLVRYSISRDDAKATPQRQQLAPPEPAPAAPRR